MHKQNLHARLSKLGDTYSALCYHNASVATKLGQFHLAESWRMLVALYSTAISYEQAGKMASAIRAPVAAAAAGGHKAGFPHSSSVANAANDSGDSDDSDGMPDDNMNDEGNTERFERHPLAHGRNKYVCNV